MTAELVILDCDGVLIDSEGISAKVLIGALGALGIEVDFDYFCVNWVGRSFPTVAQDIRNRFKTELPPDFERSYRRDLLHAYESNLRATDGVVEAVERIGLPYCVATSSSPERVARSLEITGLSHLFAGCVFTASEVARGKPAPDLFLHAAAKMGVAPKDCLVIEDSLPGIEAAHAAGMDVLRYTGGVHLKGRLLKHPADVPTFDTWDQFFVLRPEIE